ncbi:unnamed protein product [Bursaphelenchus xylophilus]|uniref:(pine wood nematode) hypothetical protein n=1 Tax=Bursaphelenchus xylophilus TaxID=6326 RepID=A0A1I7SMQ4_BURXY|nr:unnamed protein product [Bursaphelenchus xylophilus]CAG9130314.1 unnamed protein product [Bursaphelenchus xylophilus]
MSGGDLKLFRAAEVAQHNSAESCWIILDEKIYDVSKFVLEHPGGEEVILNLAGQDCTNEFNDVGHSSDARAMAEDYLIGKLHPEDSNNSKEPVATLNEKKESLRQILSSPTWTNFLIPLAISVVVYTTFKVSQRVFSNY